MIDNEFSGKVKRYALLISGVCESYRGEFVQSSDYDALQQQLDALELSRRTWMDEADALRYRFLRDQQEFMSAEFVVLDIESGTCFEDMDCLSLDALDTRVDEAMANRAEKP